MNPNCCFSTLLKFALTCLTICLGVNSFAQNWNQIIKGTAPDRGTADAFGISVSISGDYAVVGALNEDEDTTGGNTFGESGSAYIFERNTSGNWNKVQKIVASDRYILNYFGCSVSISGDYAIIGAYANNKDTSGLNTMNGSGSAYIFERNSAGVWNEVQKIVASDRANGDHFGFSVAISGDYAIIGALFESEDATGGNTKSQSGSAYIFERNSLGVWSEVQKIVASDRDFGDRFGGYAVSVSGDYVLVGAIREEEDTSGSNTLNRAGSAYLFERNSAGVWNEVQKIVASDRASGDNFGISVSISGIYALVGSENGEDTIGGNAIHDAGSVYVFERNSSGVWNEVQKIVASDRGIGDRFGNSVSISGNYAIVGAIFEDHDSSGGNTISEAGSAYIFERNGSGVWNEMQKIVSSDRGIGDNFGRSVAISGGYAIVGAPWEDEDSAGVNYLNYSGSAYIFKTNTLVELIENDFDNDFILFPNPTSGNFAIKFENPQNTLSVRLSTISGKLIFSETFKNVLLVPIELNYAKGIYFLEIQDKLGFKEIIKIIKK